MTEIKWIDNNNAQIEYIGGSTTQLKLTNIEKFKRFLKQQEGITTICKNFQINLDNVIHISYRIVDEEIDSSKDIPETEISE